MADIALPRRRQRNECRVERQAESIQRQLRSDQAMSEFQCHSQLGQESRGQVPAAGRQAPGKD